MFTPKRLKELEELIHAIDMDLNNINPCDLADCNITKKEFEELCKDYNKLNDLHGSLLNVLSQFN